ncbi:RagB/SusD family nutrient uptake outer membrane protein [Algivirga pacifica]|uniref:RagB/SusD family nutrient uptake outer membrane protein n=1 Tax=Algivirga pacifica TaxID=1162670 RepID=A0ABP9CZS9_9BACT
MKIIDIRKLLMIVGVLSAFLLPSCLNDLDIRPIDPDIQIAEDVLTSEEAFQGALSKVYAGFALSGQQGPAGQGDLDGFDEGHSQYWRGYFVCQQLPTDETINGWADGNLPSMSQLNWDASNEFIRSFYYRVIYQVSSANEFIRQVNDLGRDEFTRLPQYVAEARFLRALAYWHALDLFGNGVPFITEGSSVGSTNPPAAGDSPQGPELFNYIESELLAIIGEGDETEQVLLEPGAGLVGQADKGAAWMLLAKLYLNHNTYLGTESNTYYEQARVYLNQLFEAGYSLQMEDGSGLNAYELLFSAENFQYDNEIIFSFNYDGDSAQTFGGTTYIINASIGGAMIASDYGTSANWGGNRTTSAFVNKFPETGDSRALFFTEGQSLEILQQEQFTQGYAVTKFKNLNADGTPGIGANQGQSSVNVPVFRLADAYLMAAEIDLRLDGAVSAQNLAFVNEIQDRAGVPPLAVGDVTFDFIIDERARELYWECHRRTDLIRFGLFTGGDYIWPFKGGSPEGGSVPRFYDLMPIPQTDVNLNGNLEQNPGY